MRTMTSLRVSGVGVGVGVGLGLGVGVEVGDLKWCRRWGCVDKMKRQWS